jgi:DNA polymerase-3 subunit delta'
MIETLSLKASEGAYKIQVIWRPEYLGKEGNILLKLIEEPPPNTVFLLVAESTDGVLDTILSRTQLVRLQPLGAEAVQSILMQHYRISERDAAQAAQIAEGNVAQGLGVLQQSEKDLLELLKQWFNGVFTFNGLLIGKWVELMDKTSKVQQKNFLLFAQQLLAHAFRIQLIPGYQPPLPEDELQFVRRLSTRNFSADTISSMDESISKAIYHIERNANAKIVLLHLSVSLQYTLIGTTLIAL